LRIDGSRILGPLDENEAIIGEGLCPNSVSTLEIKASGDLHHICITYKIKCSVGILYKFYSICKTLCMNYEAY